MRERRERGGILRENELKCVLTRGLSGHEKGLSKHESEESENELSATCVWTQPPGSHFRLPNLPVWTQVSASPNPIHRNSLLNVF
jgi:hypothetical protein